LIIFIAANTIISAQQPIVFKLKAAPNTSSVYLVGDFNNWSKTANPMLDLDGDGTWETTVNLEPGNFQYRFLLDGVMWIKDPENPHWAGEFSNSILSIKNSIEPELRSIKPEMGSMIRSSSLKIEAHYIDGIGKHGLDLQSTKILLNQEPQNFFYNEQLNKIECYLEGIEDGEYYLEIKAKDLAGNHARTISSFFMVNHSNQSPIADAGHTIIGSLNAIVPLNSGVSYDPDKDPLRKLDWKMISTPSGSETKLENARGAFPSFKPDKIGRYLFELRVSDGELWSDRDSVDVYAIVTRDYPVEFSLSDSAFRTMYETSIEQAAVAGEFNRWSATANPMNDLNHDGNWTAWLDLDPGEYEYKFVVNGKHWIPDFDNPVKVTDGWNGFNSVVSVSLNLAPVADVKATFGPGKIVFDASGSRSQMGRTLLYSWYQDIKNLQRFDLLSQEKTSFPVPKKTGVYYFYLVVTDQYDVSSQKTLALNVKDGVVTVRDFSDSPDWAKDAIIYEVFLRKFTPEGNLKGLTKRIPYLKTLGINCIWLMPIWDGPTSHGYGPDDFFRIEQDYGTDDDFQEFIEQAHQAGIRVILDFIANHTSDQHPYFLSAYQNPISPFRDWYRWHQEPQGIRYYAYEFHNDWDTLPNLNYENLNVRRYVIDAATHWAKLGVDGFRCDVAW
ncbi:MAG TPA: alpha-amylase family glycosyl hydrolase, partial [bacterium]